MNDFLLKKSLIAHLTEGLFFLQEGVKDFEEDEELMASDVGQEIIRDTKVIRRSMEVALRDISEGSRNSIVVMLSMYLNIVAKIAEINKKIDQFEKGLRK